MSDMYHDLVEAKRKTRKVFEEMQRRDWRKQQHERIGRVLIRIAGVCLMILPIPLAVSIDPQLILPAVPITFLGAILISLDVTRFLSDRAFKFIWPEERPKDEPVYGIARTLVSKRKYAEAEQEYERILEEFPTDVLCHIELITIAVQRLNNAELARLLYERGMGMLEKHPDKKEELTVAYNRVASLIKNPEDTIVRRISTERLDATHSKLEEMREKRFNR